MMRAVVAVIVLCLSRAAFSAPPPGRPADTFLVPACTVHDADTLTHCQIDLPWGVSLRDQAIRLHGVDACEVTKQRQTVTVTDAEIVRGKEARDKLIVLANGGQWWVRPTGDSVYGRLEGELFLYTSGGQWVSVADWIRSNGYERSNQ